MENYEEMNPLGSEARDDTANKTDEVCSRCGAILEEGQEFCPKCGTPKKKVCVKCGAELQEGQEFCPKCGQKVGLAVDNNVAFAIDQFNSDVVKANAKKKKTPIIIGVVLVIIVLAAVAFKTVAPKIFIDMEGYLEQGNYEKAYEKAKSKDDKLKVRAENAIAVQSALSADNLKDPSSFSLRDAYYMEATNDSGETTKNIALYINGTNSYGASVSSYLYYIWDQDDKEWEYFCSVSDLEEEEENRYDDEDEKLEKLVNNIGRVGIKLAMEDGMKLDKKAVKRINKMFEEDTLDDVDLLDVE